MAALIFHTYEGCQKGELLANSDLLECFERSKLPFPISNFFFFNFIYSKGKIKLLQSQTACCAVALVFKDFWELDGTRSCSVFVSYPT